MKGNDVSYDTHKNPMWQVQLNLSNFAEVPYSELAGIHGEEVEKWELGLICKYDSRLQGVFTYDNNVL